LEIEPRASHMLAKHLSQALSLRIENLLSLERASSKVMKMS
jgi:hypothetical protein